MGAAKSALLTALAFLLATTVSADVVVVDGANQPIVRYEKSYALLIGVADYTAGWRDLPSIPGELADVEAVLREQGFEVSKTLDPDGDTLSRTVKSFIDAHGYVEENRLLIYFAGHGYSRPVPNGIRGYLVPADAPRATKDLRGFLAKAVDMNDVVHWAKNSGFGVIPSWGLA
jgi:Caspase domain